MCCGFSFLFLVGFVFFVVCLFVFSLFLFRLFSLRFFVFWFCLDFEKNVSIFLGKTYHKHAFTKMTRNDSFW